MKRTVLKKESTLKGMLLRLLKMSKHFVHSSSKKEAAHPAVLFNPDYWREIHWANLGAERQKAEVLLERRKQSLL